MAEEACGGRRRREERSQSQRRVADATRRRPGRQGQGGPADGPRKGGVAQRDATERSERLRDRRREEGAAP